MTLKKETLEAMFDNSIRAEHTICLPAQLIGDAVSSEVENSFREDWGEIFIALNIEEPDDIDFEDLAHHLRELDKQGFLVKFATPVPRNFSDSGSYIFSWSFYVTEWIYAETMQEACDKALKWQNEYILECRAKAKPKTNCRGCKNRDVANNCCTEELWDRNNLDETWLQSDDEFEAYLDTNRLCSAHKPITRG